MAAVKMVTPSARSDVKKVDRSYVSRGNIKCYSYSGKSLVSLKTKYANII